jgi:hypothetical protein
MATAQTDQKAGKVVLMVLKVLAFGCGVAVAAMGVIGLFALETVFNSEDSFRNGITGVVSSFYLLIFGLLICLAETKLFKVLKWFAFLCTWGGAGAFYILTGLLVLGIRIPQEPDVPLGLIIGGIVIGIGLINLLLSCFVPPKGPKPVMTGVANA